MGVTPLDPLFGAAMDWLGANSTVAVLGILLLITASYLALLAIKYHKLRDDYEVSQSLVKVMRKKNETLNAMVIQYANERKPE